MSKQATIWTVVVVVILIILALVFWGGNDEPAAPAPADNSGELSGIVGENEIVIEDQAIASRTVSVASVFLQDEGFVAVHEKKADGRPGAVLGASVLLAAGQSLGVSIPLNASLAADKTYIAMLHLDNGDIIFGETSDPVAQDGDGDEVLVEFQAE